jgi:alkylation response protein AidB-like acyl-CoA dehydrogenase
MILKSELDSLQAFFSIEKDITLLCQLSSIFPKLRMRSARLQLASQLAPSEAPGRTYRKYQYHQERFQSTRPLYHQAVAGGLIKGQIPTHLGGSGVSLIEAAILLEEMYTVEPAASLTIFSTGLGLTPINLTGNPEHKEFLPPFLSGESEPSASLVFSEPPGRAGSGKRSYAAPQSLPSARHG